MWEVEKNDELTLYFCTQTKKIEFRTKKFLACEEELEEMVFGIALRTTHGDKLAAMDADDQCEMANSFNKAYGEKCARDINEKRNSWQQGAKNAFFEMLAEGIPISGAKLLHVAQRQGLLLLDEVVSERNPKEQAAKNTAKNLRNKKWRDLFDNYNDKFMANCLGHKEWRQERRS